MLGIRHVALYVADLDGRRAVLGRRHGLRGRVAPRSRQRLSLRRRATTWRCIAATRSPPGGATLDHIGIAVPPPDDVDAWAAHLKSHGVPLKTQPKTHRDGSRSLYFHGPEGLLVQIIHHAPMVALIRT